MEHSDHSGVRLCTDVLGWGADGDAVAGGVVEESCRQGGAELVASLGVGLQQDLAAGWQLKDTGAEHVDRSGGIHFSDVLAGGADGQGAQAAVKRPTSAAPNRSPPSGLACWSTWLVPDSGLVRA